MALLRSFVLVLLLAAGAQAAGAAVIWNEGVNGDLSGNHLAPTPLVVGAGTNTISGDVKWGDRDYFSITIPASGSFTQMILTSFGSDDLAFVAIQAGAIITEDPTGPDPTMLLGWTHVGSEVVGTDILDDLGLGDFAIGFTPPLGPGTYSFWLQQLQPNLTSYSYDIVVVPEPSVAALFALGLSALAIARRPRG